MAFEYGSDTLGIRNPFRIEGAIRAVSGTLIAVLGLYALLSVKGVVETGNKVSGSLTMVVAVILLLAGVGLLAMGLFQAMRFFVGRGIPANLAVNRAKSEASGDQQRAEFVQKNVTDNKSTTPDTKAYTAPQLEQMLQGRKNMTFLEPEGWLTRLIYTVVPRLLFLPYGYRNLAQGVTSAMARTVVAFLCLALAWFSGTTGLTSINETPAMDWLALLLLLYVFGIWWRQRRPEIHELQRVARGDSIIRLLVMVVAAVALPIGLVMFHSQVRPLPELPFNTAPFNTLQTVLALLTCGLVGMLTYYRGRTVNPLTEVSEFRENWQESIHPQEVFINFENIVMANRRYKEVPNRVYRDFDARLVEEGSDDKGSFDGQMMQETQPLYHQVDLGPTFRLLRLAGTCVGQLLLLLAAVWLYRSVPAFVPAFSGNSAGGFAPVLPGLEMLLTAAIFLMFGRIVSSAVHLFWAEIQFESLMVYFHCRGTYTESRLRTGKGVYDSTESENLVVRSSMNFWVLASRMLTSTFASSGNRNLENPRRVLELHKSAADLDSIIEEMRHFTKHREAIASISNEKDLAAAERIYQVNEQSRAAAPQADGQKAVQLNQYKVDRLEQQHADDRNDQEN